MPELATPRLQPYLTLPDGELYQGHVLDVLAALPATVLDPFLGSGSTAIAARQLGRRFVGVDISEAYLEIAEKRLSQIQPRMVTA